MSKIRPSRNFMYSQQVQYAPNGIRTTHDMYEHLEKTLHPEKLAVIMHNKDKGEQDHFQAMITFKNARSVNAIAKAVQDKPQYFEIWDKNINNGFSYLIHATKESRKKGDHQYDPEEVVANFDYPVLINKISKEVSGKKGHRASNVDILLDALYEGNLTRADVEQRLSGSEYGKHQPQLEKVWAKRLQKNAEEWRKQAIAEGKTLQVIWIYGMAGTGKTSLAKDIAGKHTESFYMSGSSRDPFQGYAGESTIILDELRPHRIEYDDLLKITDPRSIEHGVMAPARYADKALACGLIIITSPYNARLFYEEQFGLRRDINGRCIENDIDPFEQLHRRITLTIRMTDSEILRAEYDPNHLKYIPDKKTAKENLYSSGKRDPEDKSGELFDSLI